MPDTQERLNKSATPQLEIRERSDGYVNFYLQQYNDPCDPNAPHIYDSLTDANFPLPPCDQTVQFTNKTLSKTQSDRRYTPPLHKFAKMPDSTSSKPLSPQNAAAVKPTKVSSPYGKMSQSSIKTVKSASAAKISKASSSNFNKNQKQYISLSKLGNNTNASAVSLKLSPTPASIKLGKTSSSKFSTGLSASLANLGAAKTSRPLITESLSSIEGHKAVRSLINTLKESESVPLARMKNESSAQLRNSRSPSPVLLKNSQSLSRSPPPIVKSINKAVVGLVPRSKPIRDLSPDRSRGAHPGLQKARGEITSPAPKMQYLQVQKPRKKRRPKTPIPGEVSIRVDVANIESQVEADEPSKNEKLAKDVQITSTESQESFNTIGTSSVELPSLAADEASIHHSQDAFDSTQSDVDSAPENANKSHYEVPSKRPSNPDELLYQPLVLESNQEVCPSIPEQGIPVNLPKKAVDDLPSNGVDEVPSKKETAPFNLYEAPLDLEEASPKASDNLQVLIADQRELLVELYDVSPLAVVVKTSPTVMDEPVPEVIKGQPPKIVPTNTIKQLSPKVSELAPKDLDEPPLKPQAKVPASKNSESEIPKRKRSSTSQPKPDRVDDTTIKGKVSEVMKSESKSGDVNSKRVIVQKEPSEQASNDSHPLNVNNANEKTGKESSEKKVNLPEIKKSKAIQCESLSEKVAAEKMVSPSPSKKESYLNPCRETDEQTKSKTPLLFPKKFSSKHLPAESETSQVSKISSKCLPAESETSQVSKISSKRLPAESETSQVSKISSKRLPAESETSQVSKISSKRLPAESETSQVSKISSKRLPAESETSQVSKISSKRLPAESETSQVSKISSKRLPAERETSQVSKIESSTPNRSISSNCKSEPLRSQPHREHLGVRSANHCCVSQKCISIEILVTARPTVPRPTKETYVKIQEIDSYDIDPNILQRYIEGIILSCLSKITEAATDSPNVLKPQTASSILMESPPSAEIATSTESKPKVESTQFLQTVVNLEEESSDDSKVDNLIESYSTNYSRRDMAAIEGHPRQPVFEPQESGEHNSSNVKTIPFFNYDYDIQKFGFTSPSSAVCSHISQSGDTNTRLLLFNADHIVDRNIQVKWEKFKKGICNRLERCFIGVIAKCTTPAQETVLNIPIDIVVTSCGKRSYRRETFREKTMRQHMGNRLVRRLVNFILCYIGWLKLPVRRGKFIDVYETHMSVCLVGNGGSSRDYEVFMQIDRRINVRLRLIKALTEHFKETDLVFSLSGQLSIRISPIGWDQGLTATSSLQEAFDDVFIFSPYKLMQLESSFTKRKTGVAVKHVPIQKCSNLEKVLDVVLSNV